MDVETKNAAEPAWGTPPAEPARWSRNKTLAAVGIAAVLAAGGAAAIYAADGSGSGHNGGGFGGGPGFGGPGGGPGFGGPGGPGGGPGGAGGQADSLHGQFVTADGHGGFTTELTQTGTVTAISDSSVTARSDDGFTQTYLITTDTRQGHAPLATGDTATIKAVTSDGTNTATAITPAR
jgi:hypothetical protein